MVRDVMWKEMMLHMEKMNELRPLIFSVKQPTPEEVRQHRTTHLPFRDICAECVAGAAHNHAHRSKTVKEGEVLEVPEVHWDYCFHGMLREATLL